MKVAVSSGRGEASCPCYHNLSKPYITGMPLLSTTLAPHLTVPFLFGTATRQYLDTLKTNEKKYIILH